MLRGAVVKARQAVHQAIAKRVQQISHARLLDAGAKAAAGQIESGHRNRHRPIDTGQGCRRMRPVSETHSEHIFIDRTVKAGIVDAAQ